MSVPRDGDEALARAKHLQWLIAAAVFAVIAIVAGLLLLAWHTQSVEERRAAADLAEADRERIAICQNGNQTRRAVADVFEFMRQVANESRGEPVTPQERARFNTFFDGVAARLQPEPCETKEEG